MPKINLTKTSLFLIVILILASLLRFYNLTAIALWHDEAFSALLIRYPFNEMMYRIALDVHPPLYYLVLRTWDILLGDSLLSLRLFSAFFGILTVYFSYLFMRDAFKSEKLALITASLIALSPFQIQYSVESRMYTLGTFLIVLSSWFLIKAIETSSVRTIAINPAKKYKWWIFYGLSAIAAIYTHYYLLFSIAAQGLFILFIIYKNYGKDLSAWLKGGISRGAALAYSIAFILFIPWLSTFFRQLGQVEENYWIPKMSVSSIPNTFWRMFSGLNANFSPDLNINNAMTGIILMIFIALLIIVIRRKIPETEKNINSSVNPQSRFSAEDGKWLVILSFFVPFLLAIGLSFKRSLYMDRYFVFAGIFYLMILALFINSIYADARQNIHAKKIQTAVFIFFMLASFGLFIQNWRIMDPAGRPGMSGASNYIFTNAAPDEKIYIASTSIFFSYKYYAYQYFYRNGYTSDFNPSEMKIENNTFMGERLYPDYLTPLLRIPGLTTLDQIPHFSGAALLTDSDLLANFNKNTKKRENIWVLWTTGFYEKNPEIPQNWEKISEAGFQDVFDYKGWIVVTKYEVQ